jgi:hypothetical protein
MTQKYAIVPVSSISDNIATIDVPVSHAGQQAITQVKVPCPNNGGLTADQVEEFYLEFDFAKAHFMSDEQATAIALETAFARVEGGE